MGEAATHNPAVGEPRALEDRRRELDVVELAVGEHRLRQVALAEVGDRKVGAGDHNAGFQVGEFRFGHGFAPPRNHESRGDPSGALP